MPAKPDATVVQLATRIPSRLHRAVKLAALGEDATVRDWVADALEAYLAKCRRLRPADRESA